MTATLDHRPVPGPPPSARTHQADRRQHARRGTTENGHLHGAHLLLLHSVRRAGERDSVLAGSTTTRADLASTIAAAESRGWVLDSELDRGTFRLTRGHERLDIGPCPLC